MKHPSDLLDRYSTGQLPASSLIAIDEHLVACEPCRDILVAPPGVDLDRAWAALTVALDLDLEPGGVDPIIESRAPLTYPTEAAPLAERIRRRKQPLPWLRRPAGIAVAAAVAVLIVVGGIALALRLLGPSEPPVITTPTSTPPTSLPVPPPGSAGVVIPADVVGRGSAIIASIDTAGDTGTYPAMVIGSNGLPVVAYLDSSDGVVTLMRCSTEDCDGDNVALSLGAANMEVAPALALTQEGIPIVAFGAPMEGGDWPDTIMLARCSTSDCSSFASSAVPVDAGDQGLVSISVFVGSTGTPVVSFVDGDLKLVTCHDLDCSAATVSTIDGFLSWGDRMTSAAVAPNGHPALTYVNGSELKLAVCRDAECADPPVISTIATNLPDSFGGAASLAYSPGGNPVVGYLQSWAEMTGATSVGVISCSDEFCRESTTHEVAIDGAMNISVAVAPDGVPVLVYTFRDIGIASCLDSQCAEPPTISRLDTEAGFSGAAVEIGADGMPRIAYGAGSDLKVATCWALPCTAEDAPLPPPDARGVITTTVSAADAELIGANPSLVIDGDGRPAVMYTTGQEYPRPTLIRCLDAACSASTATLVDVPGFHNTLTFQPDGLPMIVHHDWERVLLTRCADAACTTTSTVELEASEFAYFEPVGVAWDQTGAPIAAFQNGNDYYIHVVACEDAGCQDFSVGRVESFADSENFRFYTNTVDIVVPADGLPVVAAGQMDGAVRVAKCADRACTDSVATIVEDRGLDGLTSDMILGSDDLPLIAYYADGELRAAKCQNDSCTDFTVTPIGTGVADFIASVGPSLALGDDGLPVIGFWAPGRVLQLAVCHDHACSTSTISTFGEANTFALAIGPDGLPVIAYHDDPELVVAKCGDAACGSG